MTCIYTRHLYLDAAAKAALIAHNAKSTRRELRVEETRYYLICALSGCEAGNTGNAESVLVSLIEDAITDSLEVDWQPEYAARAVLDALLDEVAPMPKQEEAA